MALTACDIPKGQTPATIPHGKRILLHQFYVPNYKAKSKSRAASSTMEFLSRVFASDGASRFFKTFLLRFLFDSNGQSSDDCSARARLADLSVYAA